MIEGILNPGDRTVQPMRLGTINRLRWVSLTGQLIALLVIGAPFGFSFPILPLFLVIASSVALTAYLQFRYPSTIALQPRIVSGLLAFDVLQIGILLYLTGGLQNPFCVLLIVPVLTAAIALPTKHTLVLGFLVAIVSGTLAFNHMPFPWYPDEVFSLPAIYTVLFWVSLCLCISYAAYCTWRVALDERRMLDAMASADVGLARGQQLVALDGMAAAAAHALGTPLSTIAVISRELERRLPSDHPLSPDVEVLKTETDRCKDILSRISMLRAGSDEVYEAVPLGQFLEEIAAPFKNIGPDLHIKSVAKIEDGGEPLIVRSPAIRYGVGNLVENAIEFALTNVSLTATSTKKEVLIEVTDDGPGFNGEVYPRLGQPYLSDRRQARTATGKQKGLGLGVFIAKTLLERTGAKLMFANKKEPGSGASIRLVWSRESLEFLGNASEIDA